jgi:hypothetical protein
LRPEVGGTGGALGGFADLAECRQKDGDQEGDDGNDDEEFDESEPATAT